MQLDLITYSFIQKLSQNLIKFLEIDHKKMSRDYYLLIGNLWSFSGGSDVTESVCNAGDPGFDPWVRKILWRREWLPTPVLLPGESHRL